METQEFVPVSEAPRQATRCACGHEGGLFHFVGEKYVCDHCFRTPRMRDVAHSTFPFVTEHLATGQRIEVQSMRHLRKLESAHGVQSTAYNMESKNFDRG